MEIINNIDELTIESWRFILLYNTLFLDSYCIKRKKSTRHRNYEVLKKYERIGGRGNTMQEYEVPLREDLKQDVLTQYMSSIKVKKWSEK